MREIIFYIPKEPWGKHMWGFMHTISIGKNDETYNETIKKNLKKLFDCIPCEACNDLQLDTLEYVDLNDPLGLFYWTVDIHNTVNKKLSKDIWTYEQALDRWANRVTGYGL